MKAADATSAADSTLRAGPECRAAEAEPRDRPGAAAAIARASRARSQRRQEHQNSGQQRRAGAEERAGLRRAADEAERSSDRPQRRAASDRESRAPRRGRARIDRTAGARASTRRAARAAIGAHRAQRQQHAQQGRDQRRRQRRATRRAAVTCSSAASCRPRRPTTCAGRERSACAYATAPATPSSAADERKDERLGQQQPPDVRDREAGGAQDADLPQPLLDPEPEEQHRQQQRRHDDEEAEVGEVLAEVGRAARGLRAPAARAG